VSGSAALARPSGAVVFGAAALVLVLWSGTAIANKAAVGHMDAMTPGVLRSLLAGLIAIGIVTLGRLPRPRTARQWGLLALSGLASFAVWPMLLSLGLGATTANHAALIMAMIPVFTGLFAAAVDRRLPAAGWWLGVLIAGIGTVLLVSYRSGGALFDESASLGGDLIVLSGVAVCALGYVVGGKLSPVLGTPSTTFWSLAIATLALAPTFAALAGRTEWAAVGAGGWLGIAYLTLVSSITGYALWFWALGHGGIARIGSLQFAQPVLTLLFAVPILGEALTPPLVLSGAVILVGVAVAQHGAAPPARPGR